MSAQRFLPKIFQEIKKDVHIMSARSRYEQFFPGQFHEWKIQAFLETLKKLELSAITNIIAMGDSNIELEAAYNLASQFQNAFIKTIKFRECPSPQELTKQIELVSGQFPHIVQAAKNLTVRLQRFDNDDDEEEEEEMTPHMSGSLEKSKAEFFKSIKNRMQ